MTSRRAAVAVTLIAAAIVAVVALALLLDSRRQAELRRDWGTRHGIPSPGQAQGQVGANATAMRVEEIAARLGVSIVPPASDRPVPSQRSLQEYRDNLHDTKPVLWHLLSTTTDSPAEPLPDRFRDFFRRHRADLDELHAALLAEPPPHWELRARLDEGSPTFNQQGHQMLQRMILLDGLDSEDRALLPRALEASWQLNEALAGAQDPDAQMTRIQVARYQAGTLRLIDDAPEEWLGRMDPQPHRAAWSPIIAIEGWRIFGSRGPGVVARWMPGRETARRLSELEAVVKDLEAADPCAPILLAATPPRVDEAAFVALAVYREEIELLAIDLAITRAIMEARRHRRLQGSWPAELAGLAEAPCGLTWKATNDGATLQVPSDFRRRRAGILPFEWHAREQLAR